LTEAGLIRKGKGPAKLLANGEAAKGIIVRGVKMSAGARQKIESAGGRIEN
jgi:large subunit ribosomal protein L15